MLNNNSIPGIALGLDLTVPYIWVAFVDRAITSRIRVGKNRAVLPYSQHPRTRHLNIRRSTNIERINRKAHTLYTRALGKHTHTHTRTPFSIEAQHDGGFISCLFTFSPEFLVRHQRPLLVNIVAQYLPQGKI